jgi:tetratricopeptide (TPR) repeat protein
LFLVLFCHSQLVSSFLTNLGSICLLEALQPKNKNPASDVARVVRLNCSVSFFMQSQSFSPNVHNFRNLSLAYLHLEQYDKSQKAIQEAIELLPISSLFFIQGSIFEDAGNKSAAIAAWQKSNSVDYFIGRGNRIVNFEERVYYYDLATKIAPNSPFPYYIFGDFLYYNSSQREKAIALYQRAVALEQKPSPQKSFVVGKIAQYRNDWLEAINNYQQAINLGESSANLYMELGDSLAKVGSDFEVIQQAYERAFELEPLNKWVYWKMRELYFSTGQNDELLVWYEKIIAGVKKNKPETTNLILFVLIKMHLELGDCEIATYLYEKAIAFDKVHVLYGTLPANTCSI